MHDLKVSCSPSHQSAAPSPITRWTEHIEVEEMNEIYFVEPEHMDYGSQTRESTATLPPIQCPFVSHRSLTETPQKAV